MIEIKQCSIVENEELLVDLLTKCDIDKGFVNQKKDVCSFGVFDGDKQIGGITGKLNSDELYISLLAVSPEYQKQRIGESLLKRCEEYAYENNCRIITLTTRDYQAPEFYSKYGFKVYAELENTPFKGAKRYYLCKVLDTKGEEQN